MARYIKGGNNDTNDVGWKIWDAPGVDPGTGYAVPRKSAALILQKETQETLKHLFAKIFENDRVVCAEIQFCLEQIRKSGFEFAQLQKI